MNISKVFTDALVREQMINEGLEQGYNGRDDYLNKDSSWATLRNGMLPEHEKQYGGGSGGELNEKNGNPPKMAAFASSSRMIYTLSAVKRHIEGFRFEEKLSTTIGGQANMDGYLNRGDSYIFVEAKCREPYDHHAKQKVSQAYEEVYTYLQSKMPATFGCKMDPIKEKDENKPKHEMYVTFQCRGEDEAHFDIKQMICHLLGVATKFLTPEKASKAVFPNVDNILFLYLLYNPANLEMNDPTARSEIMRVYVDTCWAGTHYDFKTMFGYIVDYLVELRKNNNKPIPETDAISKLKSNFNFDLCDQFDYHSHF